MSLNISKIGHPLCIINGGDYNGTKVYVSDEIPNDKVKKSNLNKTFEKLKIEDEGVFQQIPDTKKEREVGMVCGQSGSGKSTYIKKYCKEYIKSYKKNNIYMFSNLKEDETLKDLKINRIKIDDSLITEPLTVEDFKDSLVLFDDIDVIRDKKVKEAVYQVMNEILETGRHFRVSCVMTVHYPNKPNIRTMLNECHFFVYFPWGAIKSTHYTLENYLGVDRENLKKIKSTKSRWACIFRNFPQVVLTEKNIFMLANEEI
jgi:energy-coupling factor transporter ATP-binding protein EcfA2